MSTTLTIDKSTQGKNRILKIKGEVDAHTVTILQEALDEAFSDGMKNIIYDCTNLAYFASAAIGATAAAHRKLLKESGDLAFASVPDEINSMLKTLTARKIRILPSIADAVKALGGA